LSRHSTYQQKIGRSGENMAAEFLKKSGYTVLLRNYRAERGEIDIIAQDRETLVFIEVKTGTSDQYGSPETWVDRRKQVQIGKVAQAYLIDNQLEDVPCRFDVIAIVGSSGHRKIRHFKDAFWL